MRRIVLFLLACLIVMLALAGWGYRNARADPIVRHARVTLPGWPADAKPVRVVLLSDVHIGNAAMDADRLTRIVAHVNALSPDLVLIAGDFVYGHDPVAGARFARELTAPLAKLRARLGVVAVMGNHDHWTTPTEVETTLERAGVRVLTNQAIRVGPLAIGGVDDDFTGHADVRRVVAEQARLGGATILLSHSASVIGQIPNGGPRLLLAGHSHCGQVVLPMIGSLAMRSPKTGGRLFDPRYMCGAVRDPGRLTIVTAGLGASVVPIRFGAPPDLWLLTLSG